MRKELRDRIFVHTDPNRQLAEASRLVEEGELERFIVAGETVAYIDPKGQPKQETVSHLDTLHKLKMLRAFARDRGDEEKASVYKEGIRRLLEKYPEMEHFEQLYAKRLSRMKERYV